MRTLVAFGAGTNFYALVERLDKICKVSAFCDNNSSKWGQHLMGDDRVCINPEALKSLEEPFVLIMTEREAARQAIERQCDQYHVLHQRVYDFLEENHVSAVTCKWPQQIQSYRIHKFIELLVHGTTECNFHCEYCYVWRKNEFTRGRETSEYTVKEIRKALSQKRLGGSCHINACALGETLLSKDIVELAYELLEEGHYLSIITNGTIVPKIDAILAFPDKLLERMFFKLSFHYAELKRTNLLETFWKNVDKIKNSPCSYSLEITPCDSLIEEICNIKEEFMNHADGAMPHITFTRDSNKEGLDLLSDLSLEEYKRIWSVFDSDLFDLKCDLYKKKIDHVCYAGSWSYRINVVNGNLQSCYQQDLNGTIFDKPQKPLPILTVGQGCNMDYCFNNHAFLAWGDVPEIPCHNYYQVRNRVSKDCQYWIKEPYAAAMQQKLYDNNFQYMNRWSDYEKLFADDRESAFILFNSPDYSNLGDHAIALAERKLFQALFPQKEFIEISCEQYIRENLLIRNAIQKEDILIISGGGYLGSLWLWLEDITKNIVKQYAENKILIFPQTLYFEENNLGISEREALANVLNGHKNLTLMLREPASYYLAEKLFDVSVKKLLVPDIVFSLSPKQNDKRFGSLVCIRDDKELKAADKMEISSILHESGMAVGYFSTIAEDMVCLDNRKDCLEKLFGKISSAEVVVTDRLHTMIICAITDTPCVAFDNLSGKISETYQWLLQNHPRIILCESNNALNACLDIVMKNNDTASAVFNHINDRFQEVKNYLKENCFI